MRNETIRLGQITIDFLLEASDTNGVMAMFEFGVPVGSKVPVPHSHELYDETVYGLEGVITFTVEGRTIDIAKGESYFIPRGAVHGFNNTGESDAKALAVVTPGLIGPDFFKGCAEIVNAGGPPDMNKLLTLMEKYGLVPAK